MPEQRKTRRFTLDEAARTGMVVGVTPDGRLQWIAPDTTHQQASSEAVQSTLRAEVISDQEQALIEANRQRIEELKALPYPSPDLHAVLSDMMALTHPPTIGLAVAAWILQAIGLIPMPVFDTAAAAVMGVSYVGRRIEHRLHAAEVSAEASQGAKQLWETHPGIGTQIFVTVMDRIIDSLKSAASIDDTELEDELAAFYVKWSRTDFEFDPRRFQP